MLINNEMEENKLKLQTTFKMSLWALLPLNLIVLLVRVISYLLNIALRVGTLDKV